MNIVKIQGGLGNQLFQYAFGLYLEKKLNQEVRYDIALQNNDGNYTNRTLDIGEFGVYLPIAGKDEISSKKKLPGRFWRIERLLTRTFPAINENFIVKNNPHAHWPLRQDAYYDGYFQRWDIVEEVYDALRANLVFPQDILARNQSLLQRISDEKITAIHIRRDDYIKIPVNAKIFEVCDMDYYKSAIKIIEREAGSRRFLIFTQDKEWARENFRGPEFEFYDGSSATEDFVMMAQCKNQIIANSTFSWWAAMLNPNPGKTVIYPEKWYKIKSYTMQDFLPRSWIGV